MLQIITPGVSSKYIHCNLAACGLPFLIPFAGEKLYTGGMNKFPPEIYAGVTTYTDPDGNLTPLSITWKDRRAYRIDYIADIRRAVSRAGGGIRYTCIFSGRQRYLFFGDGRWFLEIR